MFDGKPGETIDARRAWAPYAPDADRPWNLAMAGHLFRRAAFGADWGQLQQALADGPQKTVDRLLRPTADLDAFNRTYDEYDVSASRADSTAELRAWWLLRMIRTPHPIAEKMTLFWHNHFAIRSRAPLMQRHIQLLRANAMGSYRPLVESVFEDQATLLALDAEANRAARPSETLPRVFLEEFTLGPGAYSKDDVREVARAMTGWFVMQNELRFIPREHDEGAKTILGRKGNWANKDVVRIVLEQPAAARWIVRKLYRWLISETGEPADSLVAPLAESFAKDYDTGKLVETMLRSNLFFSPVAYRRRVKSPLEFALGIVKGLEGSIPTAPLGGDLAALGQDLYDPPTIKGWQGGRTWINANTIVGRSNLALALIAGTKPYGEKLDPLAAARKHDASDPAAAGRFLIDLFLQGDVDAAVREDLLGAASKSAKAGDDYLQQTRLLAHSIFALPEFQLA